MSTLVVPYNIQSYAAALAEGLSYGDRIHLGVCGNHVTEDAFFLQFDQNWGIIVSMRSVNGQRLNTLLWGDIVELWLLEEKPNIYHSDVPEVADVLKKLKDGVQKLVETNDGPGVLFLLDQVTEIKKAELLLREAREILAGIRL